MGHVKWNREIGCSPADDAASANLSEELTEEKAFLLAYAVESLNEALITRTTDGIITSWNRGSERLYGFSATEVIGKSISFLNTSCHVDEIPPVLEPIDRLEGIPHYVVKRRRKNGQIIYVSEVLSLINDKQGQMIGVSIIDRDITAEVMARENGRMKPPTKI